MHVGYWNGEVEERVLWFGGGGAGEKPWERVNARGTG
jgi:hypothetical protein